MAARAPAHGRADHGRRPSRRRRRRRRPRVGRVLVFGSVARGTARPGSDIDLVAIVNDDPDRLAGTMDALTAAASAASGRPADVLVRTPAEWDHLVANVPSSVEHTAAAEGATLHTSPDPPAPAGDKLHRVPASDADNAAIEAAAVAGQLREMHTSVSGIPAAEAALAANPAIPPDEARRTRYSSLLQKAHMAAERSLAAVRAAADHQGYRSGHDLDRALSAELGGTPEKQAVAQALQPARSADGRLKTWGRGPYILRDPDYAAESNAANASTWIAAATAAALTVADMIDRHAHSDEQRRRAAALRSAADLLAGTPTDPHTLEHGLRAATPAAATDDPRSVEHGPGPAPHDSATTGRADPAPDLRLGAPGPAAEPGLLARLLRRARPAAGPAICGRRTPSGRRCRQQRPAEPGAKCAAGHDRIR